MEQYSLSESDGGVAVAEFPNAAKVIALDGREADLAADLALHRIDLEFALHCLEVINMPMQHPIAVEACWRSAVIHFYKCFKTGVRHPLQESVIFGEDELAQEVFEHYGYLRDRHFVHDVNNLAQSVVGAVLNQRDAPHKIEKIVCSSSWAVTLGQENYSNMHLLVTMAKAWVEQEFERICVALTSGLEAMPYDVLIETETLRTRQERIAAESAVKKSRRTTKRD